LINLIGCKWRRSRNPNRERLKSTGDAEKGEIETNARCREGREAEHAVHASEGSEPVKHVGDQQLMKTHGASKKLLFI
jgi:hypothetical protein